MQQTSYHHQQCYPGFLQLWFDVAEDRWPAVRQVVVAGPERQNVWTVWWNLLVEHWNSLCG